MNGEYIASARRIRPILEKAVSGEMIDNKDSFDVLPMFPDRTDATFWDGHLITTGTRIRWNGQLMFARNDLWATPENNPDNAPTLWEHIEYVDGYRVLNGPISASNPVLPGEKCWENGVLYECITQIGNTYRPSEYMGNWIVAE